MAVIGLPDPASGERVCAVVPTRRAPSRSTSTRWSQYLKDEGLMMQKIPEQLELVDVIPRNPTGKILKHDLQAAYADTQATRRG